RRMTPRNMNFSTTGANTTSSALEFAVVHGRSSRMREAAAPRKARALPLARRLAPSMHDALEFVNAQHGGPIMTTATGHTTAIRAGKAIGTDVYDRNGTKMGEVKDIVLEKTSNNILFAVVSFGGVLGMGEKYHPVPWAELDYDPKIGGYV